MDDYEGTPGDDSHTGTAGDDTLEGLGGNDTLVGLGGRDLIFGGAGNDVLDGGEGNDFVIASLGKDTLIGGGGDDTLSASGGLERDRADGGAGNDQVSGSVGDTLFGGDGIDRLALSLTESTASVTWDLSRLGRGTLKASDGTQVSGFESGHLFLGRGADHVTLGDTGRFTVVGGGGDDTIIGGAGDDYIRGDIGNDVLAGGDGIDTLDCWGAFADGGVSVSLARSGAAQNTHGQGRDIVNGFENLFGTEALDRLTGDAGDNYLWGNGGYDIETDTGDSIFGGAGNDTLEGSVYALLDGGAGDDRLGFRVWSYATDVGYDTMIGGKGQDSIRLHDGSTALYESVKDSTLSRPDRIEFDPNAYGARIDLHLIDADVNTAGDQAFHKAIGGLTGEAGELSMSVRKVAGVTETWVLMDVDGDGRGDSLIVVTGNHTGDKDFIY